MQRSPELAFHALRPSVTLRRRILKLGVASLAVVVADIVVLRALDLRPGSLRSQFRSDVQRFQRQVSAAGAPPLVTDADLAGLPPAIQTYLRRAQVVGKPRVRAFHAVFRAKFRATAWARWMDAEVEQRNYFGPGGPARLFYMRATRAGIPFVGYHRYVGAEATMRVRLAGLIDVVNASGELMTQSETVTLFNDMCFLAPAALLDAPVTWQALDQRRVRATYTNAGKSIGAILSFDEAGDLVGFVSEDRYQSDGKGFRLLPWSTPLRNYRDFGVARLASEGDARWIEPTGEWTYGHFVLQRITYDEGNAGGQP